MALQHEYQVALSFAGEDRPYVDEVANHLQNLGISVFYDTFEQVDLWEKNLYSHLDNVYRNKAHYCVMFISKLIEEKDGQTMNGKVHSLVLLMRTENTYFLHDLMTQRFLVFIRRLGISIYELFNRNS